MRKRPLGLVRTKGVHVGSDRFPVDAGDAKELQQSDGPVSGLRT
jgi:hypothetical protein